MRRQYHFRTLGQDTHIWDVHRLIGLSAHLPTLTVAISDIAELEQNYWFEQQPPTTLQIIEHMRLVQAADLNYPIVLCAQGGVMDGMHRVAKAVLLGHDHILARRFDTTPPPDFVNIDENALDYSPLTLSMTDPRTST